MGLSEQFTLEQDIKVNGFETKLLVKKSASKSKSSVQSLFALPGTDIDRAFRALCILEERTKWDTSLLRYSDTVVPDDLDVKQILVRYPPPMAPREMHYKRHVERKSNQIYVHNCSLPSTQKLPRLTPISVFRIGVDVKMWIRTSDSQTTVELCIVEPRNRAPIPMRMVKSYILKSMKSMVVECASHLIQLHGTKEPVTDCKARLLDSIEKIDSELSEESDEPEVAHTDSDSSTTYCDKGVVTDICSVTRPLITEDVKVESESTWHTIEDLDDEEDAVGPGCCCCLC